MDRWILWSALASLLFACGDRPAPAAAPSSAPPAPTQPPAPSAPAAQAGSDPCATPGPLTLELEAGVPRSTPWDLELTYAIEEDPKRGPGYVFLLRHGTRRWETRRNDGNWTSKQTWRGFCWRGGARPEARASKLQIEIAPVCKDGKLVELGGCGDALGAD